MVMTPEEIKAFHAESKRIVGLVDSPCENYYGPAQVYKLDGDIWFEVVDVGLPPKRVKISGEFYDAFVKEFK